MREVTVSLVIAHLEVLGCMIDEQIRATDSRSGRLNDLFTYVKGSATTVAEYGSALMNSRYYTDRILVVRS